jgi:hypothetical protein
MPVYRKLPDLQKQAVSLKEKGYKFRQIAIELGILTQDKRPNPGLVERVIRGDKLGVEASLLLNLEPVCPECFQHLPRKRHTHPLPAWVKEGADFLESRLAAK